MPYFPSIFTLIAVCLLLLTGCLDRTGSVELRTDGDSEPAFLDDGDEYEVAVADRQAFLVIHKGVLTPQGERGIELDHVFDADIYAGPHDEGLGDPHWITRVRVTNADGDTLWSQRTNSMFQLLEFLSVIIEDQSPIDLPVETIYNLVRQDYPELLRFAVKVPRHIEGAETYHLEIADEQGKFTALESYPLDELADLAEPPSPEFDYSIETLVDNGPAHDRLNVAILGDGYTDEERHVFEADAQAVAERFLDTSPMREHADLFNIKSIWTPSQESGAGYDCNRPGAPDECVQDFRDTVFDTTFVIPAIIDQFNLDFDDVSDRVAMPLQLEKIYEVAALAHYDEIIFLSNSPKRSGFAGLYVALVTNFDDRDRFPDVAVHEVGHTLGLLGDEYNLAIDTCYYNEPTIPLPANIGEIVDGEVRWSEWIDEDTPIPTPANDDYAGVTGAFEGAYNCDFLVRPDKRCMMRTSGHEFCSVCAEQMVRRFYAMVDPAPLKPLEISHHGSEGLHLELPLRGDGDRYGVVWSVEDGPLFFDQPSIELTGADLSDEEWTRVSVTVTNNTDFVQTDDQAVRTKREFELKLADGP